MDSSNGEREGEKRELVMFLGFSECFFSFSFSFKRVFV